MSNAKLDSEAAMAKALAAKARAREASRRYYLEHKATINANTLKHYYTGGKREKLCLTYNQLRAEAEAAVADLLGALEGRGVAVQPMERRGRFDHRVVNACRAATHSLLGENPERSGT